MRWSELQPGDVVFPLGPQSHPWVVLAWEDGWMLYLSEGRPTWWSKRLGEEDTEYAPEVLIVRGTEAVNGGFP